MNVSSRFPIALKVAKDMLYFDKSIENILLVGGCKESQIVDYDNPRSLFMFNFADGGSAIITDGSFHDDVRIPAGGSKLFSNYNTVENRQHYIDVINPISMKKRLDSI